MTSLRKLVLPALALCLLLPRLSPAASVDLFSAAVPVPDQSPAARAEGLRHALAEVLVRITGDPAVAGDPAAAELLENAQRYVAQFGYELRPPPLEAGDGASGQSGERLYLVARFDPAVLERAVRAADLPYWGAERPATLIWLAVEAEGERLLVGADSAGLAGQARAALEQAARARGVPLLLPLLDAEDRAALGFVDVWGGFDERIRAASERYAPDSLLVGRLQKSGADWQAEWRLLGEEDAIARWRGRSGALPGVMREGVDPVADAYAARFALRPGTAGTESESVELHIAEVASLQAYGQVLEYLRGLTPVRSLQVLRLDERELVLRLRLNGGVENLERALELGSLLEPAPRPTPQVAPVFSLPPLPGQDGMEPPPVDVAVRPAATPELYYRYRS